jgi:hypothetical protein
MKEYNRPELFQIFSKISVVDPDPYTVFLVLLGPDPSLFVRIRILPSTSKKK